MKQAKQLLSCLLVLLLAVSMLPQAFAAGAAEGETTNLDSSAWNNNTFVNDTQTWNIYPSDPDNPAGYDYGSWAKAGGHAHQYTGYTVLRAPTCTSYGEAYMYCAICGESRTEVIQKLPHTWGEWTILEEATDHSAGLREHTCQVCGTTEQEHFDPVGTLRPGFHGDAVEELQHLLVENGKLDHHLITRDYDWQTEQAVKAAEKDAGMDQDGIAWPKLINHLHHDFGSWTYTVIPTYETAGHKERTCIKCGYVEKVDIGKKLERGAYGDDVLRLQERLTELGFNVGTPDGSFGRRTEDVIKAIEGILRLKADGIVWPGLWSRLFPDEDTQFGRDSGKPLQIIDVFLPEVNRPPIKVPDFVRSESEEEPEEDKAALDVKIELTNDPSCFDYYYSGEYVGHEITITNTGNVAFSRVDLELTEAPYYNGSENTYPLHPVDDFGPGESVTLPAVEIGVVFNPEGGDRQTKSVTVTAKGRGSDPSKDAEASDTISYPFGRNPAHVTVKIESLEAPDIGGSFKEGDEILYQISLTNDGEYPLKHAKLSIGVLLYESVEEFDLDLAPGSVHTVSGTYTVSAECAEVLDRLEKNNNPMNFMAIGYFVFDCEGKDLLYNGVDIATIPK